MITGRALADLEARVGWSAEHTTATTAWRSRVDRRRFVHPGASAARDELKRAGEVVRARLDDVDGVLVGEKGVTSTVHYRMVDDEVVVERVREAVRRAAERHADAVRVTGGKQVLELPPDVDWYMGDALRWLSDGWDVDTDGSHAFTDTDRLHAVYVGDDVSDEAAFCAVDDAATGLVVDEGSRHPGTAPDYPVETPAEVAEALRRMAEARG